MKVGYTAREAYSMYRSLAKEVFNTYSLDIKVPRFTARERMAFHEGIADTGFAENMFGYPTHPEKVRINPVYLPLLYEDEMIVLILHELAHVVAGFKAQHGPRWMAVAEEIGSVPSPVLIIRKWMDVPGRPLGFDEGVPTLTQY